MCAVNVSNRKCHANRINRRQKRQDISREGSASSPCGNGVTLV